MSRKIKPDNYFFDDFGFLHLKNMVLSHEGTMQYFDEETNDWIGVYMPVESLQELACDCKGAIITDEHPVRDGRKVLVDNHNFKNVAVGYLDNNNLKLEGSNLIGSLVIADSQAIESVLSGEKKGVSLGYTEYKFPVEGVDSNGTPYKEIKKGLKLNHIALTEKPRAANALIALDSRNYTSSITAEKVTIRLDSNDFPILIDPKRMTQEQSSSELTNQLLQQQTELTKLRASYDSLKSDLEAQVASNQDLNQKLEAAQSAAQGATAALDSYKEAQPTQEIIDAIVAERVAAWQKVGDKVAFDSAMSALDIQRARLSIDFPNQAAQFKEASAEYLNAFEMAFDSLKSLKEAIPPLRKPLFDSVKPEAPLAPARENAFVRDEDGTYSLFNLKNPRKRHSSRN